MASLKSILNRAKKGITSSVKSIVNNPIKTGVKAVSAPPKAVSTVLQAPIKASKNIVKNQPGNPAQMLLKKPSTVSSPLESLAKRTQESATAAARAYKSPQQKTSQESSAPTVNQLSSLGPTVPSGTSQPQNQQATFSIDPIRQAATKSAPEPVAEKPAVAQGPSQSELARQRLLGLMQASPEEQALQNELIKFRESANLGISGLEGQGRAIPLNLIRGQQAKLAEQAGIREGSLMDRLALAAQQRQTQANIAQTELEAALAEEARQQQQSQPFEFNGALVQYDPTTGELNTIAEAPTAAAEPITLSAGQTLYDPNTGQVLYSAPNKPESVPTSIQEYLFATQQGYTGSYQDFQNQSKSSGPLNATQSKALGFYNRAQSAEERVQNALANGVENIWLQQKLPRQLQGENYKLYIQAAEDFIKAALRAESGAAIPPEEMKSYIETYFPQPGDTEAVLQQKEASRQGLVEGLQASTGTQIGDVSGSPGTTVDSSQYQPDPTTLSLLQNRQNASGQTLPTSEQQRIAQDVSLLKENGYSSQQIADYVNGELGFNSDLSTSQNGYAGNPLELGKITAYGSPLWKHGLDIDLKKGDPLGSTVDGVVEFVGPRGGFGNQVRVRDAAGNVHWFSHLDGTNVQVGQQVSKGQQIGIGGNSGSTIPMGGGDGSHLDYTVVDANGNYVDPKAIENFIKQQFA